jgi:hypothetical protein
VLIKSYITIAITSILLLLFPAQNAQSNYLLDSNLAFNGTVRAIVNHNGTKYIGGTFTKISLLTGSGTIVDKDTGEFLPGYPKINGKVNIAIPDGNGGWFIGGEFTRVGDFERNRLAQIDASGNLTSWAPSVDIGRYPYVYDMVKYGNLIYVSGSFQGINNEFRSYMACIDLNGNLTTFKPKIDDEVFSIAIANDTIYAGGNFRKINDVKRDFSGAISINGTLASWNPEANNFVRTIEIDGNQIYLGGAFTKLKGEIVNRLGIVKTNGLLEPWFPNVNSVVESISLKNSQIYIGGRFTKVNNLNRLYLASFDMSGALQNWTPAADGNVFFVDFFGDKLYAAGAFGKVNNQDRAGFASINNDGTVSDWNPSSNGTGLAISMIGDDIFIGGNFTGLGGVNRNYVAAIDADGNFTSWDPNPNADVSSISYMNGNIYISGNFTKLGAVNRKYLAAVRLDGTLSPFSITPSAPIYAVKAKNDLIYVGGNFSKINNIDRKYIAVLDTNGALTPWECTPNASVYCLDVNEGDVYIGGFFTMVNGSQRNRAAAIDSDGNLMSFNPDANNVVLSILYYKENIYLGGWFSSVMGESRSRLAAFDADGSLLNWNPSPDNTVWTIYGYHEPFDVIYIGGDFTKLSGQDFLNLAAVDLFGNILPWTPNPDRPVYALAGSPDAIYSGGDFRSFENSLSPNYASLSYYTQIPEIAILVSPVNNALNQPIINDFIWEPAVYASHYRLQIGSDANFANPLLLDIDVFDVQYTLPDSILDFATQYFWRVLSKNSQENSVWSEVRSFVTQIEPPDIPVLINPENDAEEVDLAPMFVWNEALTATSYSIEIASDSAFTNIISTISNISDTTFQLPGGFLASLTQYWWRMRASNEGGAGLWSDSFTFTTMEYIVQEIQLGTGWNLISMNIFAAEPALEDIFSDIVEAIEIVKDNAGNIYFPEFEINTIGNWNFKEGYSVYTKSAATLEVIGLPVFPAENPITLSAGWNQIAYLRNSAMNIEIALEDITDDNNLVIVKDNSGNIYYPEFGINTIGDMTPGQGYQLFIIQADTLVYPDN